MAIRKAAFVAPQTVALRPSRELTAPRARASVRPVDTFESAPVTAICRQAAVSSPEPKKSSGLLGLIGSLFGGLLGGLKSMAASLLERGQGLANSAIAQLVVKAKDWAAEMVGSLIDKAAAKVTAWVTSLFDKLIGKLGS